MRSSGPIITVLVEKKCQWCERPNNTRVEYTKYRRWQEGEYVQSVWPEKSPDEREALVSGTHPECWEAIFPPEDEEE